MNFTLKEAPNDPHFQAGVKELKVDAVVAGVGCVAGGGAAAAFSLGIGTAPGCLEGMLLSKAVYGAASYGVQVTKGLMSAYQGQYGSTVTQIATATAEQLAGKAVPGWSMNIGGTSVAYFLGAFYENVPAQ